MWKGIHCSRYTHFVLLVAAVTIIVVIGELAIRPMLSDDQADVGTSAITGALIVMVVGLWGIMRERRIDNIERMVKALYDHHGLGGGSAAGRAGKDDGLDHGRGGAPFGGDSTTVGRKGVSGGG